MMCVCVCVCVIDSVCARESGVYDVCVCVCVCVIDSVCVRESGVYDVCVCVCVCARARVPPVLCVGPVFQGVRLWQNTN